jgi:hypothetical protein
MSNRDWSHVTQVKQKSAQTLAAAAVVNSVALATIPGFIVKGGVPSASVAIDTKAGVEAAGATVSKGVANPIAVATAAGTNTNYNSKNAVAAARRN